MKTNRLFRSCSVIMIALLFAFTARAQCISGPSSYDVIPGGNVNSSSHYFSQPNAAGWCYMEMQAFGSLGLNSLVISVDNQAINYPGAWFFYQGGSVPMTISFSVPPTAAYCSQAIINLTVRNSNWMTFCTYSFNVNVRDNAKELLTTTIHGTYYVSEDHKIQRLFWTPQNGWQHLAISPTGGWGTVQADGWLGAEYYDNKVFFRSRDSKLYVLTLTNNVWTLGQILTMNNVKSDIQLRPNEIFYVGTDSKIHRVYWNGTWNYEAINPLNGWQGVNAAGSIALAQQASNVFFRTTGNGIMNLVGSTGNWNLWGIYPPVGCGGDMVFDDATGLFYKGTDNLVHKLYWNVNTWTYDAMTPNWNPGAVVANHLTKFPGEQRVFYKGTDGKAYNIYWTGSQWEPQPLNNSTAVGGDLFAADGKIFFVSQGNSMFGAKVGEYGWTGSSWYVGFQVPSAPNVKGCSTSYRLANPDEEGIEAAASGETVPEQPATIDASKTFTGVTPYPNPANGSLTVSWTQSKDAKVTVALYNAVGGLVKEMTPGDLPAGTQQAVLALDDVAPGVYLLRVTNGKETSDIQKVIVQ